MAMTSKYEGYLVFDKNHLDIDEAASSALSYQMANNVNHWADQAGQVRVAWANGSLTTASPATTATWSHIATFGPFPLTIGEDGLPYPMRARIAGSCSLASNTATFRVVVQDAVQLLTGRDIYYSTVASSVLEATSSSTTPAWLTATASKTLLTFADDDVDDATETLGTIDGVGGNPVSVGIVNMVASVWAQSSNTANIPTLNGLYLAEYKGTA